MSLRLETRDCGHIELLSVPPADEKYLDNYLTYAKSRPCCVCFPDRDKIGIIHTCGHVQAYSRKKMEYNYYWARQLSSKPCTYCRGVQDSKICEVLFDEYDVPLPPFEGSAVQIEWASNNRNEVILQLMSEGFAFVDICNEMAEERSAQKWIKSRWDFAKAFRKKHKGT